MTKGRVISRKGFTKEEFKRIKELAAKEIPFPVNMRQHPQRYALGGFQISPRAQRKNFDERGLTKWSREEFKHVLDFLISRDIVLSGRTLTTIEEIQHTDCTLFDMQYHIYSGYFSFMTQAVREK
ncbi:MULTISPECIES: hypothetical protein [Paenibacillus]|uniref:Uncharacterized protein n=2 Tax=Paenibacillus TaxID=44249 RepID=A0A7Y6BTC1_9BACL|nr:MULTISPECIES: hypothetical protein [Paenibacillus]KGP77809.1 hypothetical protein P364_0131625 [Paenibacillus sp. MAEPY2]KGP77926.1 hypothetical protein P363_0132810 [Paenibacillus sp. MAEPY1]MDN4603955.1 hypothetical protein [Paenibacillus vandeheii]NUU74653.1 hypothetical protein [Paenibacillus xylanilyticus]